jgi:hypothetical protein
MRFIFEDVEKFLNFTKCEDVNPSGIKRFGVSPLLNASYLFYTSNDLTTENNFHTSEEDVKNYIISCGVNHSPEDWTGYVPRVQSLFSHLNEKYLRDLRNGEAILLIDQSFEGYQTHWLWEWFHNECNVWQISPKYIVYVTGNMVVDEFYDKWATENNITERIKVIGYPHFELDLGITVLHMPHRNESLPTWEDHIKYKTENIDNIKAFACLNKRLRPHRIWFYKYMFEAGILDKGLVSMNKFHKDYWWFENKTIEPDYVDTLTQNLPLLVYGKRNDELDDNHYIRRFNDQICLDTFVTVISEAHCGDSDETMFISEKTYKVIACRQPFIIMGNKNTLKKLRECGYKTFDGFIDESYDSLSTFERMEAIIESLKKIISIEDKLSWFKSMEDIVEHNYNTFMTKLKKRPEAYMELQKYVQGIMPDAVYKKKLI